MLPQRFEVFITTLPCCTWQTSTSNVRIDCMTLDSISFFCFRRTLACLPRASSSSRS